MAGHVETRLHAAVTRRGFARGATALALAAAIAAPAIAAPSPDAELIRLCVEAKRLHHLHQSLPLLDRNTYTAAESQARYGELQALWNRRRPVVLAAAARPALTPAGVRAKAGLVRDWIGCMPDATEPPHWAGEDQQLAWSLMADLLTREG